MKSKYGKDWEEVYLLHQKGNVLGLTALQSSAPTIRKSFKAENDIVSKYLSKYEIDTLPSYKNNKKNVSILYGKNITTETTYESDKKSKAA